MRFKNDVENGVITFRGVIGTDEETMISSDMLAEALSDHDGPVTINLNSPGGVVTESISAYNAIKAFPHKVHVHIDALCASGATLIACAADTVSMFKNAKYMIHRAWTVAVGNCRDFKHTADLMEMMDRDLAEVYSEKTGMDQAELLEAMTNETWYDAPQALEAGFVDSVTDPGADTAGHQAKQATPVATFGMNPALAALARMSIQRARRHLGG